MDPVISKVSGGKVECLLCPHNCRLANGKTGICGARRSNGTSIELITYGVLSGMSSDPVEKKPLYHYFPGSRVLSVGSYGCNMKCDFCQNYHISQNIPGKISERTRPEELISLVRNTPSNIGIAFTYNEPVIWFEYVRDVAEAVRDAGFHTVMVSNGFVSETPLREYTRLINAFNIDLKAFNDKFYRKIAGAEIEPVKRTLKHISLSGNHLEITTLLIPGLNDSKAEMEELIKWISGELGRSVPFHISRYFPMHRRTDHATPYESLMTFHEIAIKYLDHVYVGNVITGTGQDTICPKCKTLITRRSGYKVYHDNTTDGSCSVCGTGIYRNFIFSSSSRAS